MWKVSQAQSRDMLWVLVHSMVDEVSPHLEAVENFCEGSLPQMTKSTRKIRKKKA